MTTAQFESISLVVGIGGLMALMLYIVYDLAKQSHAGRRGTVALFLVLGLGIFSFLAKSVIQVILEI